MAPRPQLESYKYGSISVNNSPNSNNKDDEHAVGGGRTGDEESLHLLNIVDPEDGLFFSTSACLIPSFKIVAVCFTILVAFFVAAGAFKSQFHGQTATHSSQSLFHGGFEGGDFSPLASPIEMGLRFLQRENDASPSNVWSESLLTKGGPLPTNSWFLVRYKVLT
jgi:hypothetical protein